MCTCAHALPVQICSGSSETSGSAPLPAAQPRLCQASRSGPGLGACAARARHFGTTAADAAGRSAWRSLAARVANTGLRSGSAGGARPLASSTQAGPARYARARSVDSERSGRGSLRPSCRLRLCQVTLWARWAPPQLGPGSARLLGRLGGALWKIASAVGRVGWAPRGGSQYDRKRNR